MAIDDNKGVREWPDKKLAETHRRYPLGDDPMYGKHIAAEINRRRGERSQRYVLWGVIAAALSATGSMIAAIVSLITLLAGK